MSSTEKLNHPSTAEHFWQQCFNAVPQPLCVIDQTGCISASNASWRKLMQEDSGNGLALTEGCAFFAQLQRVYAATAQESALLQVQQAVKQLQAGQCEHSVVELPSPRLDKLIWFRLGMSLLSEAEPDKNQADSAKPSEQALLISLENITSQKMEQEAMQTASQAYQFSDLAILVTDASARIIAVNPGYTHLTGYSLEEVLGKNPGSFKSGRQSKDFYQLMWHTIRTTGSWQGEIWNRKKNGDEFAEWITINAIYSAETAEKPIAEREIVRYVAMFSDITEQKLTSEKHWRLANFDPLTHLPNRRLMLDRLETELRKANRHKRIVTLFFIDLDHFKEINDQLGHAMGDVLLQETAQRLQACVRESDTVARLGGDEFIIVMGDFVDENDQLVSNSHQQIEQLAEKVLHTLGQPFQLGEQIAHVSGSIGIAMYPQDAVDSHQLLECADQAMYQAKHGGKNRFCYFDASKATDTTSSNS